MLPKVSSAPFFSFIGFHCPHFLGTNIFLLRNPPAAAERWIWQAEWKHKNVLVTFLPENLGDTWTCWETDRQPAVQQHLICHRPAVSPSCSTSKSMKTSGNCSSIIVSQSTAELRLFNRRLLGMIINALGCQQALPRNIKKTRITPGALLRKGIYHLLHCSSCYTATSNYSPSCVHRRSNLPGRLIEKYCVNILVSRRCTLLFSSTHKSMWSSHRDTFAQTCANHVKVRYTITRSI